MTPLSDAVAAVSLLHSGNIGFKQFSFRHITRVLRDSSFGIFRILPLSRHAVVPFTFRLQVSRVTQGYSFRTPPNLVRDQTLDSLAHPAICRRFEHGFHQAKSIGEAVQSRVGAVGGP
jgi:hypothetical protein